MKQNKIPKPYINKEMQKLDTAINNLVTKVKEWKKLMKQLNKARKIIQ